jgi:hypothetical protein
LIEGLPPWWQDCKLPPSPLASLDGTGMHRCPLAPYGLTSDLMTACPGFDPSRVEVGAGPGAGLTGQTCCHLGSGPTTRGFVAACLHPEAERVVPEARRLVPAVVSLLSIREARRRASTAYVQSELTAST